MMTAQVQLTGSGGQTLSARALIDSGAGMSLVSNRVAQLLKLKLSKTDLQFSGVQGTPCKAAKHITNLSVSPVQVHAPTIRIAAAVVSTVTNDLPTQDLSAVSRLPHLTCIDLVSTLLGELTFSSEQMPTIDSYSLNHQSLEPPPIQQQSLPYLAGPLPDQSHHKLYTFKQLLPSLSH